MKGRTLSGVGAALAALVPLACTRAPADARTESSEVLAVPDAAVDAGVVDASLDASEDAAARAPIPEQPLFTNLAVPGFPDAVVALPNGVRTRRPVLIVLHGTADRPDWNCDAWRHITRDYGFVLCLRGDFVPQSSGPDDRRFTLRGGATLARHIDAALAALAERYADNVDVERPVLAGFSLGASQVAALAIHDPSRFSHVAVVEGGQDGWTTANIRAFARGGGKKVLFACGSPWCASPTTAAIGRMDKQGFEARWVHASVGHSTDRPLQEAIMVELGWLLDGDPRWPSQP